MLSFALTLLLISQLLFLVHALPYLATVNFAHLPSPFFLGPAVDDNPDTGLPHTTDKRTVGNFGDSSRDVTC